MFESFGNLAHKRRYSGGKTRYGGLGREASWEPLIPADTVDHRERMLQREPMSDLQGANA